MKCTNCGSENAADTKYCVSCNHEQNATTEAVNSPTQDESSPTQPMMASSSSAPPMKQETPAPSYTSATQTVKPVQGAMPGVHSHVSPAHLQPASYPQYTQNVQQPHAQPQYSRPVAPQYQQPYNQYPAYPPYNSARREKQVFTITDAYIIIGFVLAIVGIFEYSFVLLPASIAFSVVGFVKRVNTRTLGLSIAGIVVGVVAILIRVAGMLTDLGLIPEWLSAGIF